MSELGNRIRALRSGIAQQELADRAGLSLRTICKLEAGESVRLATVQQIAKAFNLSEVERMELIVLWIQLELGTDFRNLRVEVKSQAATLRDADHLPGKIQVAVSELPRRQQEQVLAALGRPAVLRCLAVLNDLFDSLRISAASENSRS